VGGDIASTIAKCNSNALRAILVTNVIVAGGMIDSDREIMKYRALPLRVRIRVATPAGTAEWIDLKSLRMDPDAVPAGAGHD